jgi:hypothetical protein
MNYTHQDMKKYIFLLLISYWFTQPIAAQGRGVKIGYIDMEYILQNVPEYSEAKNLLEQKAQKWKQEIDVKKNEITKLKESLRNYPSGNRVDGLPAKTFWAQWRFNCAKSGTYAAGTRPSI